MNKRRNGSKGDSNPASFDCESGVLPLSHRTPQIQYSYFTMVDEKCGLRLMKVLLQIGIS